jgi:L-threonylcarbamoyladenylate synthase
MPNTGDSKPPKSQHPNVIRQAGSAALDEAGGLLRAGQLVAFPTETVYGLGADATNGEAVARIFSAKGRPNFNPLIVHVSDLAAAARLGHFPENARKLAAKFWPGPLTLVVIRKVNSGISELVSAGLPSLALRVPDHPIAQALLRSAQRPLAAPSANRSGHVSATRAEHVADDLAGKVSMILDGGATEHGLESTVVEATGDSLVLLRSGSISVEAIEEVIGQKILRPSSTSTMKPNSPGQLESHYAPRAAIRMNAFQVDPGEALLAFGPSEPSTAGPKINLSPTGDLIEAAANLFAALRELDATGAAAIAVMPIPIFGIGEAINDRLQRAAAPRG